MSSDSSPAPTGHDVPSPAPDRPALLRLRSWGVAHRREALLFGLTFVVLASFSAQRFFRQSEAPHFVYQSKAWLEGRTDLYEAEYRLRTRAGGWRWVLCRGRATSRDNDGRALQVAGVTIDIDARKRAELALRDSEARLAAAVLRRVERLAVAARFGRGAVIDADLLEGHLRLQQPLAERDGLDGLPDVAGVELAGDIYARWPNLPVVLMSGHRHPPTTASITGWLAKPFSIDDVINTLDRVLR